MGKQCMAYVNLQRCMKQNKIQSTVSPQVSHSAVLDVSVP